MDSKKNRKIVENYMEEKGLKSAIFELFETETVKEKIKKGYDNYVSSTEKMISRAPEDLKENVEKLKSIMNEYTFEDFLDDVRVSFMANQYAVINITCMAFNNAELESIIIDAVKKTYKIDNEAALKDVDESINGCLKKFSESSLSILYNNYVPNGIPEEVISLIKIIAGGRTIVPATAIFDFDESADEESIETSEASEEGNNSEDSEE